jgi:hypothetical protein
MILLGLCTMGTSAAALVRDGVLVAAIEEERLSRVKNDGAFPLPRHRRMPADRRRDAGRGRCRLRLLAAVAARDAHPRHARQGGCFRRGAARDHRARPRRARLGPRCEEAPETGSWGQLFRLRRVLGERFGPFTAAIRFHDHHRTHQLYGEAMRDWDAFLSLSYDGGGEADSTVLSLNEGGQRRDLKRIAWPNSLGHFYSFFTGYLGFTMLEGEYKMMGLAPYGKPMFAEAILERILRLTEDGGYALDTRALRLPSGAARRFPEGHRGSRRTAARARCRADRGASRPRGQRAGGFRGGAAAPARLGEGAPSRHRPAGDLGRLRAQRHRERPHPAGGAVPGDHRAARAARRRLRDRRGSGRDGRPQPRGAAQPALALSRAGFSDAEIAAAFAGAACHSRAPSTRTR